jgi:predicted DNA-binding transcriptional regulator AlpA
VSFVLFLGRAWTVDETASFLGYSSKHIYRLIRQGKIQHFLLMRASLPVRARAFRSS